MPLLAFGPFQLLKEQRVLLKGGAPVRLSRRAFDLLALLAERPGDVVDKHEIARRVWQDAPVGEANIRVHVSALRQALGDGRDGARYITNVANRGYCFVADVREASVSRKQDTQVSYDTQPELPRSLTRVIGRDEAIEDLISLLSSRRLISLVGPGGIGKTTLARGLLERLADTFERRVIFVDLAPLSDPALVASVVAGALGPITEQADPLQAIAAHLAGRTTLIVIDNCEHVLTAAGQLVQDLLARASLVRILTTSRESLKVEAEHIYRLSPLSAPPRELAVSARDAMQYPAVELFVERAMANSNAFTIEDHNAGAIAGICRRLDGIPLAIELAAATINTFGVHALAAQIHESFSVLTRGRRTALPRQRTLEATLDWSHGLLSDREKMLLRRLGIFSGAFSIYAAQSLLNQSPGDDAILLADLGNLTDKSLVVLNASADAFSFRLLDSTRAYALAKLAAHGEHASVARRHADYFCRLLKRMADQGPNALEFGGVEPRAVLDNVRSALDWAGRAEVADSRLVIELTLAAVPLWALLSLTDECVARIQQARALHEGASADDVALEIELWLAEGLSLLYARGPRQEVGAALQRAVTLDRSRPDVGDVDRITRTHNALSLYYNVRSEPRQALAIAWRFYRRIRAFGNHPARSIAEYSVGTALHSMGDQRNALTHLERAIGGYDLVFRPRLTQQLFMDRLTSARVIRGWTLWLLGFPDRASRQAAAAVEDTDHVLSRCFALCDGLGSIAILCGDLQRVRQATCELDEILESNPLQNWRLYRTILRNILNAYGDPSPGNAMELQTSIMEWAGTTGYRHRLALLIAVVVDCLAATDRLDEAHRALGPISAMAERGAIPWFMPELLRIEGELARRDGTARGVNLAERRCAQSLECARKQGAIGWELRAATSLARVWHLRGDMVRAYRVLSPVHERFTEGHGTEDLRNARQLLERLAEATPEFSRPTAEPMARR